MSGKNLRLNFYFLAIAALGSRYNVAARLRCVFSVLEKPIEA
jgi:hypothetical protein